MAIMVGIMAASGRHGSKMVVKSYILIHSHEAEGGEREEREDR